MQHRTVTVKAQFLSQGSSPCGICGGQSDTRRHFFQVIQYCHVTVIPYKYSYFILIHSSSFCIILVTESAV